MKISKPIWIVLMVSLGIAVASMLLVDVIPPHSKTDLSMNMCKRRVLLYAAEHGKLPASIQETHPIEGYNSSIKDGWGNLLDYSVDGNGVVRFTSLGKDRKPGGTGENLDMIGTFSSRRPDGSWSDEFVDWIQDPFEPVRKEAATEKMSK